MKIAMISEHADPLATLGGVDAGGQNVHVAELSAGLTRLGHDVIVYTRRESAGQQPEVITPDGYRVVHVPAGPAEPLPKDELLPYMDEFGDLLAEDWHDRRPDLAHAHFWMSGLATLTAADRHRLPTVQTFHALGVVKRRHLGTADPSPAQRIDLECGVGRSMTGVIATCSDEVFELSRLGVPTEKISVVPCGVDLGLFTPDHDQTDSDHDQLLRRRQPHRVVAVGRLVARKGFDTVITALAHLPEVELIIAGGPEQDRLEHDPEAVRLQQLADQLGVADRVRVVGALARPQMPALLRSADAVLCTPRYEPFGIVPLEAMACGRPVIASAVGGLTDTVIDGATGYLVPPQDPDTLADRVRQLLADPQHAADLGRAGHRRARTRYSWDRVASDTARAYHAVLQKGAPCVSSASTPSSTTRQPR